MSETLTEVERMVVSKVLDAPCALAWEAWTTPDLVMQWWGPQGFTCPVCEIDLCAGGQFLFCMKAPDGQEFWNGGVYHEIVPHEKIVFTMYFADAHGNKVEPAHYGMEHKAIEDAHDVALFEDLGSGRAKLTFIGNESMQDARESGQLAGMEELFDKLDLVVAGLAQAK